MKKFITGFIGVALFVAGYHYVHRHAEYISAKNKTTTTAFITPADRQPQKLPPIFASRLSKPYTASGSAAF